MKIIESPVKRWPGTVGLREELFLDETMTFNDALWESGFFEKDGNKKLSKRFNDLLPLVMGFVEEWKIEGYEKPADIKGFKGVPMRDASAFASWLINETISLVLGKDEVPNE